MEARPPDTTPCVSQSTRFPLSYRDPLSISPLCIQFERRIFLTSHLKVSKSFPFLTSNQLSLSLSFFRDDKVSDERRSRFASHRGRRVLTAEHREPDGRQRAALQGLPRHFDRLAEAAQELAQLGCAEDQPGGRRAASEGHLEAHHQHADGCQPARTDGSRDGQGEAKRIQVRQQGPTGADDAQGARDVDQ